MFKDRYGMLKTGWLMTIAVAIGIGLMLIVLAISWTASEIGCDQVGYEYNVDSDYRFFADQCFLITDDGKVVSQDNYRAIGIEKGWIE
jgi:hypothetical protein